VAFCGGSFQGHEFHGHDLIRFPNETAEEPYPRDYGVWIDGSALSAWGFLENGQPSDDGAIG